MQKPSLGRQVRYRTAGQEFTATIAYVHSDECVNLCVFEHLGGTHGATSVLLASEGASDTEKEGRWYWPARS